MEIFTNQAGNQQYTGRAPDYDQVNYQGALADYTFTQNANGTVTAAHPTLGTDTLSSIDGFWFLDEAAWYSIEDAIQLSGGGGNQNPVIEGTVRNDLLRGANGVDDVLYGDRGNDTINGRGGNDTVNYDGSLNEYTITQNGAGTVTVTHATWGTDTLRNIENLYFGREDNTYTINEALAQGNDGADDNADGFRLDDDGVLNGTAGNDRMTGTGADDFYYGGTGNDRYDGQGGYNQVNFDGDLADYTITQTGNRTFTFDHPVWGTDTLIDIDGLWLAGEAEWYAVDAGILA